MTRQSWRRLGLMAFVTLAVVGGGVYYWLFLESPKAGTSNFTLDVKEVRRLASTPSGEAPREIRFEHVMDFNAPEAATVTGDWWKQATLWGIAYQLVYADRTVILDTAMSEEQAKALGSVSAFHPEAYARLIRAMSAARLILVTHEHPDHIGGLAAHPELARLLRTSVRLTQEQANNPEHTKPAVFPDGAFANYRPLVYDRYSAIAPGVVLIKGAGHSLGSQMIYVRKTDGTELLFLGDIAWLMRNVELVRGRPRYISNLVGEQREVVLPQLAAVHALIESEPKLVLMPGHDAGTITALAQRGVIKEGFE